jgi:hypothetical protein
MENKLFYLLFYLIPFHLHTVFLKCPNARLSLRPVSTVPGNEKNMKLPEPVRYRVGNHNAYDVVGTGLYADAQLWSLARGKIVAF